MTIPTLPDFPHKEVLTPRQLEVTALLVHGFSSKEMARELGISPRTIEDYRNQICGRLNVRNAVDVTRIVYGGFRENQM